MTNQPSHTSLASETSKDLQAAIAARHELGPTMEEHVTEAFLARIEEQIQARVDGALAKNRASSVTKKHAANSELAVTSMGISIPLIAIVLAFGMGIPGVILIIAGVVLINLMYLVYDLLP